MIKSRQLKNAYCTLLKFSLTARKLFGAITDTTNRHFNKMIN